jgi:hypothetical protein
VTEIQRVQDAVRFLQSNPDLIRLPGAPIDAADRYLRSNIQISGAGRVLARVEGAWLFVRYRPLLRELDDGVRTMVGLFSAVSRVCEQAARLELPELLGESISALVRTSNAVVSTFAEAGGLLRIDRFYRMDLRPDIEEALALLGSLDALNSMARATSSLEWTLPELIQSDSFTMEAEGVYHPFVARPVTNPVRLTGGEPLLFLTGPNMAGKTTYLRAVAVVVWLAQVGMGVPASRVRLTPVEALFTSLNSADNLRAGLSYFLVEVMRVKEAAAILADKRRALVIFDEVFKGTNVRDALEASAQVILGFARTRRSGCIFSSHLSELVDALRENQAITYCYFDGELVGGAPRYGYRLREGVSDQRFGLHLLRQAQVPELLERIA